MLSEREIQNIEANRFAVELLMPLDMLLADLGDEPVDVETDTRIPKLAEKYGVSEQLMTFRIGQIINMPNRRQGL